MTYYAYMDTPAGPIILVGNGTVLSAIYWRVYRHAPASQADWIEDASKFANVITQLSEYFTGKRTTFDIKTDAHGTPFQERVWRALTKIKFGETRSYQQIANAIGAAHATRAVGAAIGRNPLSIVVPCHRVVASDGKLTGYAGGLESKRMLLEHEGVLS